MGEAKRKRDIASQYACDIQADIILQKCSAGNDSNYCCVPEAKDNIAKFGEVGWYVYGDPLPRIVCTVANTYNIDPHDLDWHVEAIHGWEFHDTGYNEAVLQAAECLQNAGYVLGLINNKNKCAE